MSRLRSNTIINGPGSAAVEQSGLTFVTWADTVGTIGISRYNGQAWRHKRLDTWQVERHNNPSVVLDSQNRVVVAYCDHGRSGVYVRRSTAPYGLDFDARVEVLPFQDGTGDVPHYPTLLKTGDGRIWLLYMRRNGISYGHLEYITSDDDGATWSSVTRVFENLAGRSYFGAAVSNGELLIATAKDEPTTIADGQGHGYFLKYASGAWRKADGTAYTLPATAATADKCFDATAPAKNFGFNPQPFKDGSGDYGVYVKIQGGGAWLMKFGASAWSQSEILPALGITSTPAIDATDPYKIYAPVGAAMHVVTSSDAGGTWGSAADQTGASNDFIPRPVSGGVQVRYVAALASVTSNSVWSSSLYDDKALQHYVNDFEDVFPGTLGADWKDAAGTGGEFKVQTHPTDASRVALRTAFVSGNVTSRSVRWQTAGTGDVKDAEVLIRWSRDSAQADLAIDVMGRATGYTPTMGGNNHRVGHNATSLRSVANGTVIQTVAMTVSASPQWYYTRFRLIGTSQQAKTWAVGDAEPAAWQLTGTATAQNVVGAWGLFTFSSTAAAAYSVDWYAIATGGETALMPDYDAGTNAEASGAVASIAITAPAGTATGETVVDVTASGDFVPLSLAAPAATATGTTVGEAVASGDLPALALTAPVGTAAATASASASGAAPIVVLSAPAGTASGTTAGAANASGVAPSLNLTAPTGSASSTSAVNGIASGLMPTVTLTAPTVAPPFVIPAARRRWTNLNGQSRPRYLN